MVKNLKTGKKTLAFYFNTYSSLKTKRKKIFFREGRSQECDSFLFE